MMKPAGILGMLVAHSQGKAEGMEGDNLQPAVAKAQMLQTEGRTTDSVSPTPERRLR